MKGGPALLALVASALAVSATVSAAPGNTAPGSRERPIAVDADGWVLVPLPAEVLVHTLPEERDLRVWDPGGREVPHARVPQPDPSARWEGVAIAAVDVVTKGWTVRIDTGGGSVSHDALRLDFVRADKMPRVALRSGDGEGDWTRLGETTLFRLGTSAALQDTDIAYPPTTDRYLLLDWPRESGAPRMRSVQVHRVVSSGLPVPAGGALSLPIAPAGSLGTGGEAYTLSVPGLRLGPGGIALALADAGTVGYRLLAPAEGAWHVLAAGTFTAVATAPVLTLDLPQAVVAPALRLELHAGGGRVPRLTGAWVRFDARVIAFQARGKGAYALSYGGVGAAEPAYVPVPFQDEWRELPLTDVGPERLAQPARLPPSANALGAPLPPLPVAGTWAVRASGAAPGDVVRLDVGMSAYDALGSADPSSLRLVASGRQVPYVRHVDPLPEAAVQAPGVQPSQGPRAGVSAIRLEIPAAHVPLAAVELAAPAEPFRRPVRLAWIEGDWTDPTPTGNHVGDWVCPGFAANPCGLTIPIGPSPRRELEVRFVDGDDAPLPRVDVTIWRRVDALTFVWPPEAEGGVHLVAVPGAGPPSYDLALVADDLLALPHRSATMEEGSLPGRAGAPVSVDALLTGAVVVAAIAMLAVLARILRRTSAPPFGAGDPATDPPTGRRAGAGPGEGQSEP